jgi:HD-GYP domain-containing protein (c-di-GMP phosphodiesterase class II)
MKGDTMSDLILGYPVYSLDGRLLIPTGATLSEEDLYDLISSSSTNDQKTTPFMQFGTVRKDILHFLRQPPGNAAFSNEEDLFDVIEIMEYVQFTQPIYDSVRYFKKYDPYTYRHILMVFAFSALLSKDLVPNYRTQIREAATGPLHDFGKVCVPIEILKKRSPLTREERKRLEHHAIAGYILLSYYSRDTGNLAACVARNHHERNNGSGYPRGISLNDRLVEIVAVCDIYDALTSTRPYRPVSFDNRSALDEITMMAERGEVSWEVVQSLVSHNRTRKPHFTECNVSLDKRGIPPPDNVYGILID